MGVLEYFISIRTSPLSIRMIRSTHPRISVLWLSAAIRFSDRLIQMMSCPSELVIFFFTHIKRLAFVNPSIIVIGGLNERLLDWAWNSRPSLGTYFFSRDFLCLKISIFCVVLFLVSQYISPGLGLPIILSLSGDYLVVPSNLLLPYNFLLLLLERLPPYIVFLPLLTQDLIV